MIVIGADWIREHWTQLVAAGRLPIPLSRWDDGDAFTLATLGPLSGRDQVIGFLTLDGAPQTDNAIVVSLSRHVGHAAKHTLVAPDGNLYAASNPSQEVQIVEVATALRERRQALLETDMLAETRVAVIGLGTGGIHVALELAKAGVGQFVLVDGDRLEVGNVARHHAGISLAGRMKVYVAKDLIHEKNPDANVEAHPVAAGNDNEELIRAIIGKVDVIVCAADGRPAKLFLNRLAVELRKVAVYGGAFRRAFGGQVLRVRPGQSPCFQCFVMSMPEQSADEEIASVADAAEIAYADRPVPIEPGLSLDVAPIALMVARLALNELLVGRPSDLAMLERDLSAPWYLWLNRPEPGTQYAALPPLSESIDEMTIMRWYGICFDCEPSCPVCGDFAGAMRVAHGLSSEGPSDLGELPPHVRSATELG